MKMSYTNEMSTKLNNLLTKNYDAEAGFKKAAELTENPQLKQFFDRQAQNRYNFGHEMKQEIEAVGGTPDKGTSFTADAHRAWMGIKDAFTTNTPEAILEEVVKGETANLSEYRDIVSDSTLPPTTQNIIQKQVVSISDALQNAKNFEAILS